MTFSVRSATELDYAALAEVQSRAVEECLRPLYDADPIDRWIEGLDATKFARVAATGEAIVVAESEGKVIGFASYHPEMAVLGMWYVDPVHIGAGVGSALLARAEEGLARHGCETATTEASLFARPRFEARGWTVESEFDKPAFGGTFRVARMSKAL